MSKEIVGIIALIFFFLFKKNDKKTEPNLIVDDMLTIAIPDVKPDVIKNPIKLVVAEPVKVSTPFEDASYNDADLVANVHNIKGEQPTELDTKFIKFLEDSGRINPNAKTEYVERATEYRK